MREEGLSGRARLLVYASSETRGWAAKAAEVMGLGRRSLRLIAADAAGRMRVGALRGALAQDHAAGSVPFAVIANAGTVNTGAIDPCRRCATCAMRWRCRCTWMGRLALS